MSVLFLQTAEATYRRLLDLSSRTVTEYCARHKYGYGSFFGIIRGYYSWHATYNRIPLLKGLVDSGYVGWVCYLDADAYIGDLSFDLRGYLSNKGDVALIIASGTPTSPWWDVNAGVFLINLAHPVGQAIVREWARGFDEITDEQLRAAKRWSQVTDDQQLLARALQAIPEAERSLLVQKGHPRLLNYEDGQFIRQILRVVGDLEARTALLATRVEQALGYKPHAPHNVSSNPEGQTPESFLRALYRVLLLREPDASGLAYKIRRLQDGISFEESIRSFLGSSEFAAKHRPFIETHVGREESSRAEKSVSNLTILANKYGSDKGTEHGSPPHKYTYMYDLILDRYRHRDINLLELSLATGGPIDRHVNSPSVQMWLEYFPSAHIYGFDISDFSHIKHPRFTALRGDGGSVEDMERLANAAPDFDIIIDDGSRASYHQQLAFRHLFQKLRPGGIYVIEDLHWQSAAYEGKQLQLPKTRDFMISFFERGEYLPNDLLSEEFMRAASNALASYAWFPAFSGVASPAKLFVLRKTL